MWLITWKVVPVYWNHWKALTFLNRILGGQIFIGAVTLQFQAKKVCWRKIVSVQIVIIFYFFDDQNDRYIISLWVWYQFIKALANEDTLLQTHCCPWCFLSCANWETFVADTKCFCTKSEKFFVSATNVARAGKRGNICVGNNVSSFARAFKNNCWCWHYVN